MKRWIALLGAVLLGACAGTSDSDTAGGNVSVADAQPKVSADQVAVIDVRTADEHQAERIAGSTVIPYNSPDLAGQVRSAADGKQVLVYCRSGRRSKIAMDNLHAAGMTDVINLDGGITAWKAAGGAVQR